MMESTKPLERRVQTQAVERFDTLDQAAVALIATVPGVKTYMAVKARKVSTITIPAVSIAAVASIDLVQTTAYAWAAYSIVTALTGQ